MTSLIEESAPRAEIIDGLLSAEEFVKSQHVFARLPVSLEHSPIESFFDGPVLRGQGRGITQQDVPALPHVFRALWDAVTASDLAPDVEPEDLHFACNWSRFPPGTGVDWHDDGGSAQQCAFIFYVHEEWSASWGGGLIVSDWSMSDVAEQAREAPKQGDLGHAMTASLAPCRYVVPAPNRLVILKSPTPHRVEPVHMRAGDRMRDTITGFVRVRGQ